jgi:two-component system cell cycle sensor histidine kinase PleC
MLRERDLVQAKESAERAYAAKTQFLANMSHELRTPLNAVIGFSEMMERQLLGPLGNEKYVEYITGIRKSGEHLLDLISDILDMSKIEAGKYDLSLEKINVVKTARLAIHMVEGRTVNNNVKLQIEVDNENTNMVADRRAVMQIILNLLSNAVKFSKYGGLVQLKIRQNGNFVFIIVKDQGIGIPADKLATITEPFEQVESHYTREYEGTGLGLAITKELTELHGGALKISSVVGEGTEVIVRLPIDCSLDN